MKKEITTIFNNSEIIIINKEPNIFVFQDKETNTNTLLNILKEKLKQDLFPITSLDYEASGIVVFAKNKKAYEFICNQFKQDKVKKTYHILVNGILEEEGTIDKNLVVNNQNTIFFSFIPYFI